MYQNSRKMIVTWNIGLALAVLALVLFWPAWRAELQAMDENGGACAFEPPFPAGPGQCWYCENGQWEEQLCGWGEDPEGEDPEGEDPGDEGPDSGEDGTLLYKKRNACDTAFGCRKQYRRELNMRVCVCFDKDGDVIVCPRGCEDWAVDGDDAGEVRIAGNSCSVYNPNTSDL